MIPSATAVAGTLPQDMDPGADALHGAAVVAAREPGSSDSGLAPAAGMSGSDLWSQALADLEPSLARATFDTWLRGSQAVGLTDGRLLVQVNNGRSLEWLQGRLEPVVQRVVSRITGGAVTVAFAGPQHPAAPPRTATRAEPGDAGPSRGEPIRDEQDGEKYGGEVVVREKPARVESCCDVPTRVANGGSFQWVDFYIKLKLAFRKQGLRVLKGPKLSVFMCLALHVGRDGLAAPGIKAIMRETGFSRVPVCRSLEELETLGLIERMPSEQRMNDRYRVLGYAWFGDEPAPSLWEEVG